MTKPTLRKAFMHYLLIDFDGTADTYTSICQFVFPFAFEDLLDKPIDQITIEDCQRKHREIRKHGDGYVFAGTRDIANCSLKILEAILDNAFKRWSIGRNNPLTEMRQRANRTGKHRLLKLVDTDQMSAQITKYNQRPKKWTYH